MTAATTVAGLAATEDILKYQQELMSFQRNQKEVQKETIKLLNTLNKTLSLMLDRLDEFALKTNIKLDESNNSGSNNSGMTNGSTTNNSTPETIYITTDSITNSISNICNTVNNTLSTLSSNNTNSNNSTSHLLNKNELIFINDLASTSFLDTNHPNNALFLNNNHLNINGSNLIKLNASNNTSNTNAHTNFNSPLSSKESPSTPKIKDEENNQQRFFNKFVRESVEKRLGKDFLLFHEIQEIDQNIMEEIKREALQAYPPVHIRPRRAWHLAKASLRCRRRSLKRQKERNVQPSVTSLSANSSSTSTASSTPNQSTIANII